ncbi:steroid monooxygenase-like protein [Xylogone sp. PMI_703]|nr:steroid monooxygenase-like protein [Xylogone sp. PMI_703]
MAATAARYFESQKILDPAGGTKAYEGKDDLAFALSQVPMGKPRAMKIIVAGAGISGLAFAHDVHVGKLKDVDLTVYEKNVSVGGTWFENRYPGCACDIPVHNYQYSWAPNPYFDMYYAGSADIHRYLEAVTDQHNLRSYIKTSHKITGAKWIEEKQKWEVSIRRTDGRDLIVSNRTDSAGEVGETKIEECDVFINATGYVNDWKWPAIPNRESFRGSMYHSAAWDPKADLKGKTVALIGNGSSGVQILPAIIDDVEKVYVFIRSPTWITAGFAPKHAGPSGENVVFTQEQKQRWAENPEEYLLYRKEVEAELNARFRLYLKDTTEQANAKAFSIKAMTEQLAPKPELIARLVPDFAVGCRRPTPGNGYLTALCSKKCEVIWGEIDSFTPDGLRSASGVETAVDTIICRNGVNLQTTWDKNPECYLSATAMDMPNYFIYLGPASPIGHGSLISTIEMITSYIMDLIRKLQTENYGSLCIKPHIARAWQKHAISWLEKSSWNSHCASTYKNGTVDGPLISLHPGSRIHFFSLLQRKRYEDFDWTSLCQDKDLTFAWLANGFTVAETEESNTSDLTWFLKSTEEDGMLKAANFARTYTNRH